MAPQFETFSLLGVFLTPSSVTRCAELFLSEPPGPPFERHRCSFCMVFTWFSHMFYFQASFAERSLSLSQKNFVNWWKATKTILFDQIFIEIAWPSKTIVNTMQIKPSEASLTLHIWRLGGLWGAYRALWERSWSLWSVMNLLLATSLPSRRVILCGIYMVFSHPVFSSLFHRAQHISILRKQCNFGEWYKSINFLHFFHQFRLTFKNPCK